MFVLAFAALLAAPQSSSMGSIHFPVTGGAACQRGFDAGMLALHSFMYDRAHLLFQAAAKDPACAMARWGDAMAYSHPVWSEENVPAAKAALQAIPGEEKLTAKERAFLGAARALWGEGDAAARRQAWLSAAARMHADFPGDDEVALEYALALIASADRLNNVHRLMAAAALSMDVLQRNPNHPGAAHYLIHACDSSDHAILALPAARRYAQIAPAASHALHMPSHIFVQLGMYAEVAASNEASWAAGEADWRELKKNPDERGWHSYSWLADAYLNLGKVHKAEAMVRAFREMLVQDDGAQTRFGYATTLDSYLNATGRWSQLEELAAPLAKPLPLEKGEPEGSLGCAMHAPGGSAARPPFGLWAGVILAELRAQAAMVAGDEAEVARAYQPVPALLAAMSAWGSAGIYQTMQLRGEKLVPAMAAGARAVKAPGAAAWSAAVDAFQTFTEVPDLLVNGPAFYPPSQQLLGDALLAAGRPREALAAYDRTLALHPLLARSLLGAARAAKAAGEVGVARERYAALAKLWEAADADLTALGEAREALKLTAAAQSRR